MGPRKQALDPENVDDEDEFPDLSDDDLQDLFRDELHEFFIGSLQHPPPSMPPPPTHPSEGIPLSRKQYRIMTGARLLQRLARRRKRPSIPKLKPNVGEILRVVAEPSPEQENVDEDDFSEVSPDDLRDLFFDDLRDWSHGSLPHPPPTEPSAAKFVDVDSFLDFGGVQDMQDLVVDSVPPPPLPLPLPPYIQAMPEVDLGSVFVDGLRRSARHQPVLGSIVTIHADGRPRRCSARLQR